MTMFDPTGKAPGVYVEEITPAGPIAGAGTSIPALIGTVSTPPADAELGRPVAFTNWTAYAAKFGGYQAGLHLPFAVRGFFENGGTSAYVVPVKDTTGLDGALDALTRVPDVAMVCLPGVVDPKLQAKVVSHCETMKDRFAVLDGAPDHTPLQPDGALQQQRAGLTSDNGFGALYWPWIQILDPAAAPGTTPKLVSVPPSGHVAGVMARCDNSAGVHKAPANEVVRGAVGLDYTVNDSEQGALNNGINCIRSIPGRGLRIWGARTLSADTQWRYVNVRRLVSYIEDSIVQGVSWALFSPNNTALWKGLERSIEEFLARVWEAGALFGATAKEAFYVQINEELNPPAVRDLGEVFVEIGLAPTRPAEYIVLRIGLWDGGAQVTEG
jgi:phage tail sheath protein FI